MTRPRPSQKVKHMRSGRPRLVGVPRNASGRICETRDERNERMAWQKRETEAETMATALLARQNVYDLSEAQAKHPEAGHVLGRIYLDGTLGEVRENKEGIAYVRLTAGKRYAEDMARYYGLTGIPFPSPRAMELFRIGGYDGEVSAERARQAKLAANHAQSLEAALLASCGHGRQVAHTVKSVCLLDIEESRGWPEHMMKWLRTGLDELVLTYGVRG